jgi:hypothetical protein
MTLNQYAKHITRLIEEGHGSRTVIYAKDSEGNHYEDVVYNPSLMDTKDIERDYSGKGKNVVVCIN